jgi:hypothetical protein
LREQLADGVQRVVGDVDATLLGIGHVLVRAGADHELALVGLRDVGVDGVGHHHAGKHRLHRLGDERLEGEALERHPQAGLLHDHAGVARRHHADPRGADEAAGGLHPLHRPVEGAADARDLAVLDDVHAERIGRAGIAPGHRVVAGGAAAPLQGRAHDRVAQALGDVERRAEFLGLFRRQPLVVDAVEAVGVDVALEALHVVHVVGEHHHPAGRIHDVVVQLPGHGLPELEGVLVDGRALVVEIVRPDDGGVAAGVAAAEPALLKHGDVRTPCSLAR